MAEYPKYSVLMSLYIKEKPEYFRVALESMLNQTVKPDEIVIVEDAPLTKELYCVLDEYKSKYKDLIKTVRNEKNLGLGLALNVGLLACKNELVARMDTDDISKLDRCEKQLRAFVLHPELSIVGGQIEEFIETIDNIVGKRVVPLTDADIKKYARSRCPLNHMSVMFRRSDILDVGNYQKFFWSEDYDLWIRLINAHKVIMNLPDSLVHVLSGLDMYCRRGGIRYFKSEKKIMLRNGMISHARYCKNILLRFAVQLVMPNAMRGFIFRHYARKMNGTMYELSFI